MSVSMNSSQQNSGSYNSEEMIIHMNSSLHVPSTMTNKTKKDLGKDTLPLKEILNETIHSKGDEAKLKWINSNEIEIEGLSKMTLHNFLLKAEALGKNVSYIKSLTVKISD